MQHDTFDELRERNAAAYGLLFEIEVILRELIARSLTSMHGHNWAKRGLPSDVQEKVKQAIKYERSVPWHRAIPHHPLYYVDFPDLKKIIVSNTNWPHSFARIFVQKAATEASLSELELLRNKVAHNRFITEPDLTVVRGAWTKLVGSIPEIELNEAKAAAASRVPIATLLRDVETALGTAMTAMQQGQSITEDLLAPVIHTDSWWFTEDYLGAPLISVDQFSELCREYSTLPRGLGQRHARGQWANQKNAMRIGEDALATIRMLVTLVETSYA